MRKAMAVLSAAIVSISVSGGSTALAQRGSQPVAEATSAAFRLASTTPIRGFQKTERAGGRPIYIAPRAALSAGDIVSAEAIALREGSDVELSITGEAARRLTGQMQKQGVNMLAVFQNGRLVTAATVEVSERDGSVILGNLSAQDAARVTQVVNRDATSPSGTAISLVPIRGGIQPGDVVSIDVFVNGATDLRSYQVSLDITGGSGGQLDRTNAAIDSATRSDYVFGSAQKLDALDQFGGRIAGTLLKGGVDVVASGYLGTYTFRASPDASGTFRVAVKASTRASILLDSANQPISFTAGSASISVGTPSSMRPTRK